jgi:hypothetical protein
MVLQAMMSIFTPLWSRWSVIWPVKCSMVATDLTHRHTGRIAKVNDVLEGQALHQRPHDSEAAHAGIEDSDGQRAGFRHGVG